jgi:hypothetical protein
MDYEQQVRRASRGDVRAFVDLTRQFQHMALVNDSHQAEDVVQEAFVAAWSALPSLADPGAFRVGCAASCGTRRSGCCDNRNIGVMTSCPAGAESRQVCH